MRKKTQFFNNQDLESSTEKKYEFFYFLKSYRHLAGRFMSQTEAISSILFCGLSGLEDINLWISQWKSMACKRQRIWRHDRYVSSVPTGHRLMKPSVLAHSRVHCCSTAQEIHCKPPPWLCLYMYISRLETYKLSHEHRGWGVSPSELSVWHFQAAGWLQSDMQAYTWSIWGGRRHISETAAGISSPGEENELQFQAECLNSSLLAYGDFYFLYCYNLNNLFPRLVFLLYVTSGLNVLKHSLYSVITL